MSMIFRAVLALLILLFAPIVGMAALAPTPSVSFKPTSAAIQNTTMPGQLLSNIAVTMSDGSMFSGNVALAGTYSNGSGACALSGVGPVLNAPTTNTLANQDGAWSFGTTPITGGYSVILNSVATGGAATLVVSYSGHTYVKNSGGAWYLWNGSGYTGLGSSDPRPTGASSIILSTAPTANSLVDSDGTWSFGPTLNTPHGYPILLNGQPAAGGLAFLALSYNGKTYFKNDTTWYQWNGSGYNGIGGDPRPTGAAGTLNLGKTLTTGGSPYNCTVVATQGKANASANFAITVTSSATPTVVLTPSSVSKPAGTVAGTPLSMIGVTMSDGSTFTGSLSLGGSYNNGSGTCALSNTVLPANLQLAKTLTASTNCSVTAMQGVASASTNFAITATSVATPSVTFTPTSASIQTSTGAEQFLSNISATMSDGSPFTGTLAFGVPNGNGSGACGLATTLSAPTAGTLVDSDGTWSFGPTLNAPYGYPILRNSQPAAGGSAFLAVSYNGKTYFKNNTTWYQWSGSGYNGLGGDPRPAGAAGTLNLGKTLTTGGSPYNCTVVATQGTANASANFAITVTSSATPTVVLTPSSVSKSPGTAAGTPLSMIGVTMSDSSTFTGSLSLGGSYGNGNGTCALSNTVLPANLQLAETLTTSTNCSVTAMQGVASASTNFAITVTSSPTVSVTLNPTSDTINTNTQAGSLLTTISVTESDASNFSGTLALAGTYGNGGGACVLPTGGSGITLAAPTTNSLPDSDGTFSFSPTPSSGNYPVIWNQVAAGDAGILLLSYNSHTYLEAAAGDWAEWNGSYFAGISGDPRPGGAGNTVTLGQALAANTYHCTVVATQPNGSASANLTIVVNPVTTGGCGISGAAATDAMAAGFNTCALYNDWTTTVPNAIGTGLPSNWLDCSLGGSTGAVWYWGVNSNVQTPCAGHVAANVTDTGGGGNLALQFTLSSSDCPCLPPPNVTVAGMQTVNFANTNASPGPGSFPYAYYEWTFRNDTTDSTTQGQAFWSWVSNPMITAAGLNPANEQLLELDFIENKPTKADFGFNLWDSYNILSTREISLNGILPATSYHTVGLLFTGDGNSSGNFSACSYADGTRIGCTQSTYTVAGEELEHRYLIAYLYYPPTSGVEHLFIKNIKVLTCANWQQSGATGMCHGTTYNGSFYIP